MSKKTKIIIIVSVISVIIILAAILGVKIYLDKKN